MVPVVHYILTTLDCMLRLRSHKPIKVVICSVVDMADVEIMVNKRLDSDTSGVWPQPESALAQGQVS